MSVIAPVHALSIPSIHTLYIHSVCTLCITSVIAPVCALSIQHVHSSCIMSIIEPVCASPTLSDELYNDEHQEFPDKFPSINYGEKNLSEMTAKIPDNVTLTPHTPRRKSWYY